MGHDLTSSYALRSIAMRIAVWGCSSSSRAVFAVGIQAVRVGGFDGRAGLVARLHADMCIGAQQARRWRWPHRCWPGDGVDFLGHAAPGAMPPFITATCA